jgi:hypothetical protein
VFPISAEGYPTEIAREEDTEMVDDDGPEVFVVEE